MVAMICPTRAVAEDGEFPIPWFPPAPPGVQPLPVGAHARHSHGGNRSLSPRQASGRNPLNPSIGRRAVTSLDSRVRGNDKLRTCPRTVIPEGGSRGVQGQKPPHPPSRFTPATPVCHSCVLRAGIQGKRQGCMRHCGIPRPQARRSKMHGRCPPLSLQGRGSLQPVTPAGFRPGSTESFNREAGGHFSRIPACAGTTS